MRHLAAAVLGLVTAQDLFTVPETATDATMVQSEEEIRRAFAQFKEEFGRDYPDSSIQHEQRFQAFRIAYARAHALQSEPGSATFGINNLADVTPEEMEMRLGYRVSNTSGFHPSSEAHALRGGFSSALNWITSKPPPAEIDWVSQGAVTKVKDQGACGVCWAFAASGALEGAAQIKSGKLTELAEQQFLDCSSENYGCNGGSVELALDWARKTSICTESENKYRATQKGSCTVDIAPCTGLTRGCVAGFSQVSERSTSQQEASLLKAVAKQPVAVGISGTELQYYIGGVVKTPSDPNNINHGVLIVGYGTDPKAGDYWKVKNSWGKRWGEGGYFRLARNQDSTMSPFGALAVLYDPVYAKISDACVPGADHVNFWAQLWFHTKSVLMEPWFYAAVAAGVMIFIWGCGMCCCRRAKRVAGEPTGQTGQTPLVVDGQLVR